MLLCNYVYDDNTQMNDNLRSVKGYAGTTISILQNCGYGPFAPLQVITFTTDYQCVDLTSTAIAAGASWIQYQTIPSMNTQFYSKTGCTGQTLSHPVGDDMLFCQFTYPDNSAMDDNVASIRSYKGVVMNVLINCGYSPLTPLQQLTFTSDGQCIDLTTSTISSGPSWVYYVVIPTPSLSTTPTPSITPTISVTPTSSLTPTRTATPSSTVSVTGTATISSTPTVTFTPTATVSKTATASISMSPSHAPFNVIGLKTTYFSKQNCAGSSVSAPIMNEMNLCSFSYSDGTGMNDNLGSIMAYAGTQLAILLNCGYAPFAPLQVLTFTADNQCLNLLQSTINSGPSWIQVITVPAAISSFYSNTGCTGSSLSHPVGQDMNLCYYVYSDGTGMNDNLKSVKSIAGVVI